MKGITIQISNCFNTIEIDHDKFKKLTEAVCRRFIKPHAATTKYEISIALVGSDEMLKINKKFLNRNSNTDVISFDLSEENQKSETRNRKWKIRRQASCGENRKLFEVVVNAQKAADEAKTRGHSTQAELALYIIHGLLHNFGFDDIEQNQAKKMHEIEDQILQQQGFGAVYRHQ